jgi:hypothetical protein
MTIQVFEPIDRKRLSSARDKAVTASVAGALFGVHPYSTPYKLWAQKTGRMSSVAEDAVSKAQQRGTLFEPVAVHLARHHCPEWQIEYPLGNAFWFDPDRRLGATPDAFAFRPDIEGRGILQIKSVGEDAWRQGWWDHDTHEVVLPSWIAIQAIVEAEVTGATWATVAAVKAPRGLDDLVAGLVHSGHGNVEEILTAIAFAWLALGKLEVQLIDVPLHEGIRRRLHDALAGFWSVVDDGRSPPPDWSKDGDTVLDVWRESDGSIARLAEPETFDALAETYNALQQVHSQTGKELEIIKPQIIELLGNAERAETERWRVTAKTQHRSAYTRVVKAGTARPLLVKDKFAKKEPRL